MFRLIHADHLDRVRESILVSARDLSPWRDSFPLRRPDGEEVWIEGNSRPVREPDGGTLWRGFMTDITERKRQEKALQTSEERFRQVAESIREVFWLADPDTDQDQTVYISPAYETIWGRSRARLYSSPDDWLDAVHPEDRARVMEAARTKQALGTYDEEYRIVRPDRTERWIRDRAFPVRDADGKVIRVAGVAEDITERRQLEAQLRQAQKMESIGQLAGGVAHDFNNWLTVILGSAELLGESLPAEGESRESIEEIRRACDRAASLTRQLLAFSRKEVIEPRVLDLNVLVTDTEQMLRRLLGEDIVLWSALDPAVRPVRVDPSQWVQVLMNLAVNARDAMPKGGRLTITTSLVERSARSADACGPERFVRLAVADTGTGMTPNVKARIFEPFFTTKGAGQGTGLGLAVVYGIVQQSCGEISVESAPGVGTTFTMLLPIVGNATVVDADSATDDKTDGKETILLVEDEPSLRRIASRGLARRGYTVLEAADGSDALRQLEGRQDVDLLLTDVVMPGMDGRELADTALSRHPGLKVLYTSGYTADAMARHGIEQEGVGFLQKPYTPTSLLRKVRAVLAS